MSADTSPPVADDDADAVVSDYDQMLADLDVAIAEARRKIEDGRVRDAENEKVRIKWIRALAYTVNIRRQVANDRDLEELAEEIEALKADTDAEGGR